MSPASLFVCSAVLILLAIVALAFAGAGNQQIPHSNIVRSLYLGGAIAGAAGAIGLIWAGAWVARVLWLR